MKAIKNKHLRLEDHIAIETCLGYGISVSKIAIRIGKDRCTSQEKMDSLLSFFKHFSLIYACQKEPFAVYYWAVDPSVVSLQGFF